MMDIDFSHLVDSLSEGVYVVDTSRKIVYWSKGAERITGWKAEEVVGTFCSDGVLEHLDVAGHRLCHNDFCPLQRAMTAGREQKTGTVVYSLTKSGKRVPVEVTTVPYYDNAGSLIGGIEVFRDLSESIADLEGAMLVQRGAITATPPRTQLLRFDAVFNPRDIVGGDFYRIERLSENACAFFLADATSHGVSAALSTLLLRSLWDELGGGREAPEQLARGLNARLIPYASINGYFASAIAADIDTASMQLRFCTMGCPPFFQLSARGKLTTHAYPGSLLGVDGSTAFDAHCLPVHHGDRLLFFTDGAFEAPGQDGVPYGLERLAERFREIRRYDGFAEFCADLQLDILARARLLQLPDDFTAILATVG
jgi:PAS domain S-box-containing protein